MDRYIEVKEAVRIVDMCFFIQGMSDELKNTICNSIEKNKNVIEDVAPVVHAHWIVEKESDSFGDHYRTYYTCSKCKHLTFKGWNFCPDCGAKMDDGDEYYDMLQENVGKERQEV